MNLLVRVTVLFLLAGFIESLPRCEAQGRGGPGQPRPDGSGPWDRDVIVYRASAEGAVEKLATFDRAGVPTIARMNDRRLIAAHQHFPANDEANFDKVAVRFSEDDGKTWTKPQVIRLSGLPQGMRFPFDPTLVPLPDGGVRMYFTSLRGRRFDEERPAIFSAITTNGVDYTFEPGMRFGIDGRPVIDCAVVLHQGTFHLFAPDNGTQLRPNEGPGREPAGGRPRMSIGYHATSPDGLNFTRVADVQIDGRRRWLGNAQSDGNRITFIGTGDPGPPPSGQPRAGLPRGSLWMATSTNGQTWQPVDSPVVSGGDPGAVATDSGGWVIVITGEPRPGTPSSRQNRRPPSR
jgi:hypothetical protein